MQRAIVVTERGHVRLDDIAVPDLPHDCILVKTQAVAINPTDWKHVDFEPCVGTIVGCDYAGIVVAIGPQVQKPWKKGDRVAGFVHGCNASNPQSGAFAQYVVAKGDIQFGVPEWMCIEEAACLGVGMTTIGQNLYQSLELPMPAEPDLQKMNGGIGVDERTSILIYGGGTATGCVAIQFARLSGLRVLTTCSEGNRARMHTLGADAVFNYRDPDVGARIREDTEDTLELVFDTISTNHSAAICAAAISSAGGCYNALLEVQCPRVEVATQVSMAYDMIGEPYRMGGREVPGQVENVAFAIQWANTVESLLQSGQVRPARFQVKPGGLAAIPGGLALLRQGNARGKLVYQVDDSDEPKSQGK